MILPAYDLKEKIVLEELADSYAYKVNTKNVFFSCTIVAIFVCYTCIWIPIILYIRNKIHLAGCILGLIPHPVLISNPRIVQFLEQRLGLLKN